jgi:hypothetical protein
VDRESHPAYLRSFQNANRQVTHGFLLLSHDSMIATLWVPTSESSVDITHYQVMGMGAFDAFVGWVRRIFRNYSASS